MATDPFGVGVTIVEAAWQLSTLTVPFILLAFLAVYARQRDADPLTALVRGQRDMALRYGVHIILGLVIGGAVNHYTGLLPAAAAIVAASAAYAWHTQELPGADPVTLDAWRDYVHLFWAATPFLLLATVALWTPLLRSVTALVFYGVIFWEI